MKKPIFVAEIKTLSPYGFKSQYSEELLTDLAITSGDYVCVHTDPRWGGGMLKLKTIKQRLINRKQDQKLVAKGIHFSDDYIKAAFDNGADYVLVVGRVPNTYEFIDKCWLEPLTPEQYNRFVEVRPDAIVLNFRDLTTGERRAWDVEKKPKGIKLIQASHIQHPGDVKTWADGFIVGENLSLFTINQVLNDLNKKV